MNWIGMIIGAVMGGLVAWTTACPGNTCPLTSRWYIPVIAGAILGLTWQASPKKRDEGSDNAVEADENKESETDD